MTLPPETPAETSPDCRVILESLPGPYLILTPALTIVTATDAFLEATMTRREEILGRHVLDVFPGNPEDPAASGVRDLRTSLEASRRGGFRERSWSALNTPVLELDGEAAYLVHRIKDVTELVRLRQQWEELSRSEAERQRRAEQRRRLISAADVTLMCSEAREAVRLRDEFLSMASHELNTPLTPLKLQIQTVSRLCRSGQLWAHPPEQIQQIFASAERQLDRIQGVVNQLLDASRIDTGHFTLSLSPCDLSAVARAVTDRLSQQLADQGCTLELDLRGDLRGVWDCVRIEQVFVNLLTNAMRYGAGGAVRIQAQGDVKRVVFAVKDHGIGIAEVDHERIFHRLQRAVSADHFAGLGIGLYLCRKIMELHGGTIAVQSRPGAGAAFTAVLPRLVPGAS